MNLLVVESADEVRALMIQLPSKSRYAGNQALRIWENFEIEVTKYLIVFHLYPFPPHI